MPKLPGIKTSGLGAGHIIGHGILGVGIYFDAKQRIESGQNKAVAYGLAAAAGVVTLNMGFLPGAIVMDAFQGFSGTRALGSSLYNQYHGMQTFMRTARTPFSHSFQHSDVTLGAQQRGMQAIGNGSGFLGSEAGLMAQRYARR